MGSSMAKQHDVLSEERADDVISIDHYRIRLRGLWHKKGTQSASTERYLSVGEIDPHCDDLLSDDVAKFHSPEEAEAAKDAFVSVNNSIGLPTDAVVVGLNSAGVILAIDGENVALPSAEDGSDIPF